MYSKRIILLLASFILLSVSVPIKAQFKVGPSIGISKTNIDVDYDLSPYDILGPIVNPYKIGVDVGLAIQYDIANNYSLKMLSYYSERKYVQNIRGGSNGQFTLLFNQLNNSLSFSYEPIKSFHTEVGLDHIFINAFYKYYDSPDYTDKNEVNRNDIGILTGVTYSITGFEFTLNYRIGLWTINARDRSIYDIYKYKPFDYMRFSVAYLFDVNFKKSKKENCPEL